MKLCIQYYCHYDLKLGYPVMNVILVGMVWLYSKGMECVPIIWSGNSLSEAAKIIKHLVPCFYVCT